MYQVALIEDDIEIAELIKNKLNNIEFLSSIDIYEGPLTYLNSGKKAPIILLDILMPEMNGLNAIPILLEYDPDALIIMHTIKNNSETIFQSIRSGAVGYIDKQSSNIDYTKVFRSILNGGAYLTPNVAYKIVNYFQTKKNQFNSLTDRENQITDKIVEAKSYKDIADELNISINTVRMHIKNIYGKLQINSKYELIKLTKSR
ncbi:LuxR C-terminal-related transcriptional regulator [Gracilimonas halophila]|uniref:LuxR C-terminal-related transcriptional regulator n=1 Tax=Gracilimonas halophila TaxID=1834464 RepID=A0ABW5JK12_9BACT